ncbi:hypothetical protein NUW54_g5213 [Trametes sanguinea]|uniref:Uncharacterized protein n=1 Tax=Trametes sanguinea TaxID=158606 RepID=A0ACC1PVS1_9APHY|nr:hypothetical protein NUW54_g5213 [Trametes sanguinea]
MVGTWNGHQAKFVRRFADVRSEVEKGVKGYMEAMSGSGLSNSQSGCRTATDSAYAASISDIATGVVDGRRKAKTITYLIHVTDITHVLLAQFAQDYIPLLAIGVRIDLQRGIRGFRPALGEHACNARRKGEQRSRKVIGVTRQGRVHYVEESQPVTEAAH